MSSYLYGKLTAQIEGNDSLRGVESQPRTAAQQAADFAAKVAALVPSEVLLVHAIVLAATTTAAEDGSTTVTEPGILKASLIVLALLAGVLFAIGKRTAWTASDGVRVLLPPGAFVAWTLLIGTSAITPWLGDTKRGWVFLAGGALAAILLVLADRLKPAPAAG